jgi:hypothetical protein
MMCHLIQVPTNGKYPLPIAPVPPGVRIEGEMLGNIAGLKFMDHDITDEQKFPELAREKYLCTRSIPGTGEILLETQEWADRVGEGRYIELVGDSTFRVKCGN